MLDALMPQGDYVTERIVFCVVVLTAAAVGSWLLQMPIRKLLSASDQRKVGGSIFRNIVRFLVWGWAICICLDMCFNIDIAGITATLGVSDIAVSLGAQQTIAKNTTPWPISRFAKRSRLRDGLSQENSLG